MALLLVSLPAGAAQRSAPLSIEAARALVASAGINRGTTFKVGENSYAIGGVVVQGRGDEFTVRIVVVPLEKSQ